jgi:hypothetical protein
MKGSRGPSIAVIEDVHWADEATLDLLKFLGRRISRTNCLLVVTYRDDEVGAEHTQPAGRALWPSATHGRWSEAARRPRRPAHRRSLSSDGRQPVFRHRGARKQSVRRACHGTRRSAVSCGAPFARSARCRRIRVRRASEDRGVAARRRDQTGGGRVRRVRQRRNVAVRRRRSRLPPRVGASGGGRLSARAAPPKPAQPGPERVGQPRLGLAAGTHRPSRDARRQSGSGAQICAGCGPAGCGAGRAP